MPLALWIAQALLAFVFVFAGWGHALQKWAALTKRLPALMSFPQAFIRFLGTCELLGALALVVPGLVLEVLGGAALPASLVMVLPWLTIVAALGCAFVLVSAVVLHLRRKEGAMVGVTLVLLLLALFVAYGRWRLAPL